MLNKIVKQKEKELMNLTPVYPDKLEKSRRDFKRSLKGKNNIIAEIKRTSPSAGSICRGIDVERIAKFYSQYANAISIVTDSHFFDGCLDDINRVNKVTKLPILRKDFIIHKSQILESRYYGADAILLIAAILTKEKIDNFIQIAKEYGMDCLVEVHTKEDLLRVLKTKAEIIGINNRNLNDFSINLDTTKKLKGLIPHDKIIVSESGFENFNQITTANTNAVLIGTSLIKSSNISKKLSSLRIPKVKICGITSLSDAKYAIKAGADFLGFNFYKESPRYINPEKSRSIINKLPNTITNIGIFVNENKKKVIQTAQISNIDILQFHGNESLKYCNSFSLPVIKAFRVKNGVFIPSIIGYNVYAFLFDTYDKLSKGGTGKSFNPNTIKKVKTKLFISGGITPQNVKDFLDIVDPYCIDACTGTELKPGVKDYQKIYDLIQQVKNHAA